jgi:HCOMODA/2-hydroxy-3-carboxy-muconic semialdehyde decarboxylase
MSTLDQARNELAIANRILAHEGVIDAFGHVSIRHPDDPSRFLISRHRAAELVQPEDILEFTLDAVPVQPTTLRLYSESVIHGCIYQARPEIQSVCHHHADAVMPYCITGEPLVPVYHVGGAMGPTAPFWDSREEFGDTNLLVRTLEEGHSLARALGPHWIVLMRRHGATVVGLSLRDLVFRTIFSTRNAELHSRAKALGTVGPLSPGEADQCLTSNQGTRQLERGWEYWTRRLQKAEALYAMALAAAPAS